MLVLESVPMRPNLLLSLLAALAACSAKDSAAPPASARPPEQVSTREVTYQAGGTPLKGFMAFPARRSSLRPAVIIVHEWWGHNEHARAQARRLA